MVGHWARRTSPTPLPSSAPTCCTFHEAFYHQCGPGLDIMKSIINVDHQGRVSLNVLNSSSTFGATCSLLVSFGIHLSTSKGEILGGAIDGNVIPGDDVNITLSTFSHPEIYNCVPKGEEEDDGDKNNNNNNY
ncbi:hypothetical protein JHK87_055298 [Glycine soja]|nr:hypothetical protein JHK87_055298 [Glycine soja]